MPSILTLSARHTNSIFSNFKFQVIAISFFELSESLFKDHNMSDDYKPILKCWKKEMKNGYVMYWADYDDLLGAIESLPIDTAEIRSRLGKAAPRLREALFGKPFYSYEIRTFEIAFGLFKPPWQRAFERD